MPVDTIKEQEAEQERRPRRTLQLQYRCKECGKRTYVQATLDVRANKSFGQYGQVLESQQKRYDKQLCPRCFKVSEKRIQKITKGLDG